MTAWGPLFYSATKASLMRVRFILGTRATQQNGFERQKNDASVLT